jgi:O-antigen/teichoic acid export membrane protein
VISEKRNAAGGGQTVGSLQRLLAHSSVYGAALAIQGVLAVALLPVYTRYLSRADYGAIETLIAGSAVLGIILRAGTSTAFFRFYFESSDPTFRRAVVRTSFWFTLFTATAGAATVLLLAEPISSVLFGDTTRATLVRAAAVGLWAEINYQQLAALLRAEERSLRFVVASLTSLVISIATTLLLVVVLGKGAVGVLVGNFTGTLAVYIVMLVSRRAQIGIGVDRALIVRMQRFGLPLVPAALAVWTINFIDRFFLVKISGQAETGVYSMAARVASVVALLLAAFQTAWPSLAFSITDDREAGRTYSYVLTYVLFVTCWLSLALGLLAPWIVRLLAPANPGFWPAERAVGLLAFGTAALAAYAVTVTGTARQERTKLNWVSTSVAAAVNITLNAALIPRYGMMGAAVATLIAYLVMVVTMTLYSQRIFYVPYQWLRIFKILIVSVGLTVAGTLFDVSLPVAIVLAAGFPIVLAALMFYEPVEWQRLRRAALGWR